MFDVSIIKQDLSQLVGFRQPTNPKYAILDASNQVSQSGLYVTDNPYAKIEYIKDNIDDPRISNVAFNEKLKQIKESSIVNVCSNVFNEPDFLDRNLLYTNTINKKEKFELPVGFIGYEFKISENKNVAFRLNRLIIELEEDGQLELLVFNSNIEQPIHQQTIDYLAFYDVKNIDIMVNDIGFYRGTFYIGFISTGQISYKRTHEAYTMNDLTYLTVENIIVDNHSTTELFDLDSVRNYNEYCGLNFDITVVDDYTDFILNNKYLFHRAIYLDTIISCLNIYASSLRSNANERSAEELYSRIMLEIEGTRPDDNVISIRGLRPEMIYEISQIRTELLKLKSGFVGKGFFVDTQD